MKNLYNTIVAAALILMASACIQETGNESTMDFARRYELSFDALTKTDISGNGSQRSVSWTDGDRIQYYTESNQSTPANASVSLGGNKAYVTIPRGRTDEFINAVYGATQLKSSSSTADCMYITSPVKSDQRYTTFAEAHVCAAFSDDLENPKLRFHNAACVVKFTSSSDVHKVVFSGNSDEIINGGSEGDIKINYSAGALTVEPAATGGNQTSVTIATGGEVSDFFFAILPVSFGGGITVDCYDSDDDLLVSKHTTGSLNTVSGSGAIKILDLGDTQDWIASAPPQAVDLGLSVKWATYNVGATKPEEYGNYFAWGETVPKNEYKWANYLFGTSKNGPFSKYVLDANYGEVDHKTILDLEDDAAAVNWKGDWRLPSKEEVAELMDANNCTWTWTTKNGVNGYKVTGKNGNSIFLPANGMCTGSSLSDAGTIGNYWSSSLSEEGTYYSISPFFSPTGKENGNCYRYFGLGVRPVYGIVPVSSITIPETLILTIGITESASLDATVLPENATYKNLTWTSSDESVATVNDTGKVTAIALGTAIISVYSANGIKSAQCKVDVNQQIQSITMDKTSLEICVGDDPVLLNPTIHPEEHTDKNLNWTSSDTSVAIVDKEGRVSAISNGNATITASARDGSAKTASCSVTVMDHVSSVSLNNNKLTLYVGENTTLIATVLPSTAANKSVVWSSDDESVATVDQNGNVSALSRGTVKIRVKTVDGSKSDYCKLTVKQYVTSISLNKTSFTMRERGNHVALTATVLPEDANDKSLTWSSSNTVVATVNTRGVVSAVSKGTATITATAADGSGKYTTCIVKVWSCPVPDAVDLGLSVKWSPWNIGSSSSEEYGEYFAWGETEPRVEPEDFSWSTYKWCNGSENKLTKYCTNSSYWDSSAPLDNTTVLESEDDAAIVNWGGSWRMPTDAEWTELRENCTWTWTYNYNGTYERGMIVTSKKAGYTDRSIFLPAAGRWPTSVGSFGGYWSSSLNSGYPNFAWVIWYNDAHYHPRANRDHSERYYGLSVRPVTE